MQVGIDSFAATFDENSRAVNPAERLRQLVNVVERQAIERGMREVNGNKSRVARQLGISRAQLYLRLRKHGLERIIA